MNNNEKYFIEKTIRFFYSLCRNVTDFSEINEEKLNDYIELIKEKYKKDEKGMYYVNTLRHLSNRIKKDGILDKESIYILINSIDPNLEMYQIYERNSILKEVKSEVISSFGFYDDNLLKYEKIYIDYYKNKDEYDFTKKMMLN